MSDFARLDPRPIFHFDLITFLDTFGHVWTRFHTFKHVFSLNTTILYRLKMNHISGNEIYKQNPFFSKNSIINQPHRDTTVTCADILFSQWIIVLYGI